MINALINGIGEAIQTIVDAVVQLRGKRKVRRDREELRRAFALRVRGPARDDTYRAFRVSLLFRDMDEAQAFLDYMGWEGEQWPEGRSIPPPPSPPPEPPGFTVSKTWK